MRERATSSERYGGRAKAMKITATAPIRSGARFVRSNVEDIGTSADI